MDPTNTPENSANSDNSNTSDNSTSSDSSDSSDESATSDTSSDTVDARTEFLMRVCAPPIQSLIIEQTAELERLFNLGIQIYHRFPSLQFASRPCLPLLQETLFASESCCHRPLQIVHTCMSGSRLSGVSLWMDGASDVDLMYEFGPVHWVCSQQAETGSLTARDADQLASPRVMRLRLEPTSNAGFYLIKREPRPECQHHDWLLLSAAHIRQLTSQFIKVSNIYSLDKLSLVSGPAIKDIEGNDVVPCLRAAGWPDTECFARLHRLSWLSRGALTDITAGGVHLVPVGKHGSPTEMVEWRLSFSRPESIAVLNMAPVQQRTVLTLKICKHQLGDAAIVVKSYYLLTALLWMSLEFPVEKWTSATDVARTLLQALQQSITERNLPCFFMKSINVLQCEDEEEWQMLADAVNLMMVNLERLVLTYRLKQWPSILKYYLDRLNEDDISPTETEIRARLVRSMIKYCLATVIFRTIDITMVMAFGCKGDTANSLYTDVARSGRRSAYLPRRLLSHCLLAAFTCAPEQVAARVHLSRTSDVTWQWDAAPLLDLLHDEDLEIVLFDSSREAVFRWCEQQNRLPTEQRVAGVPAEPRSSRGLATFLTDPVLVNMFLHATQPPEFIKVLSETTKERWDFYRTFSFESPRDNASASLRQVQDVARHHLQMSASAAQAFAVRYSSRAMEHWLHDDARAQFERSIREHPCAHPWGVDRYKV